jgi:hypothetical protein
MRSIQRKIAAMVMAVASIAAFSTTAKADETLRYDWHLRGVLSWIAAVKFPTSGSGLLQTSASKSQLLVNAGGKDYIQYQSVIDPAALRTLASANGYTFGSKSEHKETTYDYASDVAKITDRVEAQTKTRPLTVDVARDVLTTIAYIRANAASISGPVATDVFSDGKPYRVIIRPDGVKSADFDGRKVSARAFSIVAAPGVDKKKFPGVSVWLSDDGQHLPLRIMLDQQFASLELRLRSVDPTQLANL